MPASSPAIHPRAAAMPFSMAVAASGDSWASWRRALSSAAPVKTSRSGPRRARRRRITSAMTATATSTAETVTTADALAGTSLAHAGRVTGERSPHDEATRIDAVTVPSTKASQITMASSATTASTRQAIAPARCSGGGTRPATRPNPVDDRPVMRHLGATIEDECGERHHQTHHDQHRGQRLQRVHDGTGDIGDCRLPLRRTSSLGERVGDRTAIQPRTTATATAAQREATQRATTVPAAPPPPARSPG